MYGLLRFRDLPKMSIKLHPWSAPSSELLTVRCIAAEPLNDVDPRVHKGPN